MKPWSESDAQGTPLPTGEAESAPPPYVSFILRCRPTADGGVLARVSDVRSGLSWTLTDLDELPDLVRRWMARPVKP